MKWIAVAGAVFVLMIMLFLGFYWLVPAGNNRTDSGKVDNSLNSGSMKTWSFATNGNEIDVNGKKTSFDFPGVDAKDVEARLGNSGTINIKNGQPDVTYTVRIKAEQPPVLTTGGYEKIAIGMTYTQVGGALGGPMTKGRMSDGFCSRLELIQGKRRIYLTFADGKVIEKSAKDLE